MGSGRALCTPTGWPSNRLGLSCQNGEALLIDNKRSDIDGWVSMGGAGYRYIDDDTFARDVAGGIDDLAVTRT